MGQGARWDSACYFTLGGTFVALSCLEDALTYASICDVTISWADDIDDTTDVQKVNMSNSYQIQGSLPV